jgi:hypothetical protein
MRLPFGFDETEKNYHAITKNFQWLIQNAIDNNTTLRAIGAGWSFTEVAMSDGIVDTLELRMMFRIQDSFIDPSWLASGKSSSNLIFTQCVLIYNNCIKNSSRKWMDALLTGIRSQ